MTHNVNVLRRMKRENHKEHRQIRQVYGWAVGSSTVGSGQQYCRQRGGMQMVVRVVSFAALADF